MKKDVIDDQMDSAAAEVKSYRLKIKELADEMIKSADSWRSAGRKDIHDFIVNAISLEQVPEHILRRTQGRKMSGASFSAAMSLTRGYERLLSKTSANGYLSLKKKKNCVDLAKSLGLKCAERYQEAVSIEDISYRPGSVIKPVYGNGSNGVLIITADGEMIAVKDRRRFSHITEYKDLMKKYLSERELKFDIWISEEYLSGGDGEPAHDLKFYSFYNKVGFVLEIKRHPNVKYCFHKGGRIVNTGKYHGLEFSGDPVKKEWIDEIEALTSRIPIPFLRVDMYRTSKGIYFGEFTTVPGGYEKFNLKYDRILGEHYNSARALIFSDFILGKSFPEFSQFVDRERQEN